VSQIAYMVDQSHNLKPKIEAMIQTVTTAQELYAKACLVDRARLQNAQAQMNVVDAEETLRTAFFTDVRPLLSEWRQAHNLAVDPLAAYRSSGYEARISREREKARAARPASSGSAYA
jgi:L-rhamnose isomerase/sugar isomerase